MRGTLKAFGLKIGKVGAREFAARVAELVADNRVLTAAGAPILEARTAVMEQFAILDRLVRQAARVDNVCRRLRTVPGVGPVTALAFRTGVDLPGRFHKSSLVASHFGLAPRKYASGEIDRTGRISKSGDAMVRSLLFEAAMVLLTRVQRWSALKRWGIEVAKRRGSSEPASRWPVSSPSSYTGCGSPRPSSAGTERSAHEQHSLREGARAH